MHKCLINKRWISLYPMRKSDYSAFEGSSKAKPAIRSIKKWNAPRAVHLTRINDSISVHEIMDFFKSHKFEISSENVVIDIKKTETSSFKPDNAFIFMETPEAAKLAIQHLNGLKICNKEVTLKATVCK
jgi:RNA recognition motif-containing protein